MKKEKTYLTVQYFLNHKLEPEEVRRQIREFADKGYQGVFAHARQGLLTPYMSKDWWDIIDVIVKECELTGMKFQIWDEDYFPSGIAGGRTAWEHPELAGRNMNFTIKVFESSDEIELDFKKGYLLKSFAVELDADDKSSQVIDISEYCGTRRQEWTERRVQHTMYSPLLALTGNPHWRCSFTDNRFAVCWKPAKKARYAVIGITVDFNFNRTCLMDPRTTKAMLDSAYEEYDKRYGKYFGGLVEGVFFDEPSNGCEIYPWSADFSREFFKDHSYSILEHLAHLAWDIDEKSSAVRAHFRETQHRLMTVNYLEQSREWCRKRNMSFRGHLTRTEWLSLNAAWWPNELRCYKYVDIPCCDPLGKAYGFKDSAPYHSGIKVVSSAAHIFGKELAGSDCLAVIGDEVSIRDLKGMLDYQIALGINFFVVHGFSYSIEGPRKDEVPPSLFYQHSEWEYMGALTDYIKDVSEKLSGGQHICRILMLYPALSLACQQKPTEKIWNTASGSWCNIADEQKIHCLVDTMLSGQKDFDFIDEVTLNEKIGSSGKINLDEDYEVIVLPYIRYIGEDAADALKRFADNGGKVLFTGSVPEIIFKDLRHRSEKMTVKGMKEVDENNINSFLPEIIDIEGSGSEDIFVNSYEKQNHKYDFLYNRSENIFTGKVNGAAISLQAKSGTLLDEALAINNYNDKRIPVSELNSDWHVTFNSNQMPLNFWHVFSDDEIPSANYSQGKTLDLMNRQKDPSEETADKLMYRCRFMSSGKITNAKIVMEEASVGGEWELCVNGNIIKDWNGKNVFDCKNIEAPITEYLKDGNSPLINVIEIVSTGAGKGLKEMPYLYGNFKCQYPHGHKSFPSIAATDGKFKMDVLTDWADAGYPTYSGTASYEKSFNIEEDAVYSIDLGRVEDVAEIKIDEMKELVLAWPPYRHTLKLSKGKHDMKVKVTNGPGNRYRFADLPAGLLGSVKIYKEKG